MCSFLFTFVFGPLIKNQKFFNSSKEEVIVLEEMLKKMSHLFQELLEYFVLDPKKNASDEFFGSIHNFIVEYDVSIKGFFNVVISQA